MEINQLYFYAPFCHLAFQYCLSQRTQCDMGTIC